MRSKRTPPKWARKHSVVVEQGHAETETAINVERLESDTRAMGGTIGTM